MTVAAETTGFLCAGCNVRAPFEHRCHRDDGTPCPCDMCEGQACTCEECVKAK